jgi:hypothetical protein
MPRLTYFMLNSGKFFEIGTEPLPMNESEEKRYKEALRIHKMNPIPKKRG